jgi:hypothetical protein
LIRAPHGPPTPIADCQYADRQLHKRDDERPDAEKSGRALKVMFQMNHIDIAELRRVFAR